MKITKLSFLAFAASLLGQSQVFAQATWIGADLADWNVPANWSGTAPLDGGTSDLIFNSASNRTSNNGLTNLTVSSLNISAGSDNILNGNPITLTGTLTDATGNWQTINLPIAISGNRTFAINSGRLFLNGDLSDGPSAGAITKTGGAWLYLGGSNSFTGSGGNSITFSGGGSGRVILTNSAALPTGSLVRFSGGGSGELELQTDSTGNVINFGSGTGNGGTIIANRATSDTSVSHTLGSLDLSSVTMTVNKGGNVTGNAAVSFTEVKMSGGNDNNAVKIAGDADLAIASASITANPQSKRLQLDGTSANNVIGSVSDGVSGGRVSLIKANASTWKISGNTNYTGSTTVNGGTLTLDQSVLGNATTVSIAAGAVLNLNHAATDVVGGLTLNGAPQLDGVYDSTNTSGAITGTGKLQVVTTSVHVGADATLWSVPTNWTGIVPVSGGTSPLTFVSQTNRTSTNDLTNFTATAINYFVNGRDNTLNGANVLTLAGDVNVATGNYQTINMPLAVSGNRNFIISNGRLTVNGIISDGPTTGAITKSGGGSLYLGGINTLTGNGGNSLVFSGAGSGTVVLTNPAALGAAGKVVRFSGAGSGTLELQTDTSVNAYGIASGTFNGGTVVANRATSGTSVSHALGTLDLSSVTMTVNKGGNVTGTAAVSFTELKMSGGNDFNPVTLAGSADLAINGPVSITSTGISKRLRLDGTSANNVVTGVISDTSNATAGAKVNLIKSNTSTWKLQGNNTYTGDTTVSDGTLELDYPCLANTSTVSVDGVLKLNHAATDVVGTLYLGGVLQDPGIYNAGNSSPYITGGGSIEVLPATSFETWAQTKITDIQPSADATPGGDPDGDGVNNLSEFAFRGDPLSGSDNGIVRIFTDDSSDAGTARELILTIAVRESTPAAPAFSGSPLGLTVAGVTYSVEGSTNLSDFNSGVSEVAPVTSGLPDLSSDPDYEYRSFSLDASNGLAGKGFLRAKVQD
jgi:autotransporter-associated beta strand protein